MMTYIFLISNYSPSFQRERVTEEAGYKQICKKPKPTV